MKTVFIASHQQGFEADPVIDTLRNRDIPVFRFNQDDGMNASSSTILINGNAIQTGFACDGKHVRGCDIGVAWFQQPPPYYGQPMSDLECMQRVNLDALTYASFSSLNCPWFNHFERVMRAGSKFFQLQLARLIGLPIMPTLISNIPSDIREFCRHGETIAKNLATPWIAQGEETEAAYAKIVQTEWLESDAELSFAPIIYQRFCRRRQDYRIVAISGNHFCISCSPVEEQMEDVRRSNHTGEGYTKCTFPTDLLSKLDDFMLRMGIDYCSADFMEDADGSIYFLEANICGAWWWVDKYYNGNICQCIADQIIKKL